MASEIKPGFGQDRVQLSEVVPLATPFTVFLSVSTVCNFKCNYCLMSLPPEELRARGFVSEIMDWDLFLKAADQLQDFPDKIKALFLYGVGEPLTHKRLPEMVAHLKSLDVAEQVAFITNGALLKEKTSRALIDAGLDTLRISIQGLSTEKYFEVCGVKVDFDKLVENIRYYYENKKQGQVFVKIADVALEPGDEERFYDIFRPISDRMYVERITPVFEGVNYDNLVKPETTTDLWGFEHPPRAVCPICFYTLTVYPNGDVIPCCMDSDPAQLGNVKNTTLKEIWHGEKHNAFLRMQLEGKRFDHPICGPCTAPDVSANMEDELDTCAKKILHLFE